jgi:SagB-type dehydrogenase family enzyme
MNGVDSTALRLAPSLVIRASVDRRIELAWGSGNGRVELCCDEPAVIHWVMSLRGSVSAAEAQDRAVALLGLERPAATAWVEQFIDKGLLSAAEDPRMVGRMAWQGAGWRDALDLSESVRDVRFESTAEATELHAQWIEQQQDAVTRGEDAPSPPLTTKRDGERFSLQGRSESVNGVALGQVLGRQRSLPTATSRLDRARLTELLFHVFAWTGSFDFAPWGRHPLRTSPSLGARHPVEAHLVSLATEGLPAGVYHVQGDPPPSLVRLVQRPDAIDLHHVPSACVWGEARPLAPAYCVLSLSWPRFMWKYREPRYYSMALFDLGHLCATLEMCASALEIAIETTAHFDDQKVARLLGLEYLDDSPMCVVALR